MSSRVDHQRLEADRILHGTRIARALLHENTEGWSSRNVHRSSKDREKVRQRRQRVVKMRCLGGQWIPDENQRAFAVVQQVSTR